MKAEKIETKVTHTLKIEPNYLLRLVAGDKKCEIRENDRDYQVGDILEFYNCIVCPEENSKFAYFYFEITHIHSGLGLRPDYVVLSLKRMVKGKQNVLILEHDEKIRKCINKIDEYFDNPHENDRYYVNKDRQSFGASMFKWLVGDLL